MTGTVVFVVVLATLAFVIWVALRALKNYRTMLAGMTPTERRAYLKQQQMNRRLRQLEAEERRRKRAG